MKADQERVKNLLIDTVTLLCKNSLTYEDELCVEGLLGVKVDQKDVFFVHISETFPSALSVQKAQERQRQQEQAAAEAAAEAASPGTPGSSSGGHKRPHSRTDSPAHHRDSPHSRLGGSSGKVNIKTESADSEDDCCITEDPSQPPPVLRTPSSVGAHPAQRIAGQRRAAPSPRSPAAHSSDSPYSTDHHHQQTFQQSNSGGYSQEEYPEFSHVGKSEGDGGGGDGEPPRKRERADMSEDGDDSYSGSQWPNLAGVQGIGDFAGQVAQQAFQDSGDSQMSGGGEMSQPGCSSWPTGLQQPGTDTVSTHFTLTLFLFSSQKARHFLSRQLTHDCKHDTLIYIAFSQ